MPLSYIVYTGPLTNDLTSLQGKLLDLEAGSMRGLRPDWPQFAEVTSELAHSYPTAGANAGIPADVYDHFVMCNVTVDNIDEKLGNARKQVEVLEESRAFYVDARQNDIALMVDSMRSRAQRRKDSSILSPFEKTIAYNSQMGDKAANTRKQNAAKAKGQGEADVDPANLDAATKGAIESYKADLDAKFNQAVADAVEKKLAEMKPPQGA